MKARRAVGPDFPGMSEAMDGRTRLRGLVAVPGKEGPAMRSTETPSLHGR